MGISKGFVEAFKLFIEQYQNANSSIMTWAKDTNYITLKNILHALLEVINSSREADKLTDQNLINLLSSSATELLNSDPLFASSVNKLIFDCRQREISLKPPITISVDTLQKSNETTSLDLTEELKMALHHSRIMHEKEIRVFNKQMERLTHENKALQDDNDRIRKENHQQSLVVSEIQKLDEVKKLLVKLNDIIDTPSKLEKSISLKPFRTSKIPPAFYSNNESPTIKLTFHSPIITKAPKAPPAPINTTIAINKNGFFETTAFLQELKQVKLKSILPQAASISEKKNHQRL